MSGHNSTAYAQQAQAHYLTLASRHAEEEGIAAALPVQPACLQQPALAALAQLQSALPPAAAQALAAWCATHVAPPGPASTEERPVKQQRLSPEPHDATEDACMHDANGNPMWEYQPPVEEEAAKTEELSPTQDFVQAAPRSSSSKSPTRQPRLQPCRTQAFRRLRRLRPQPARRPVPREALFGRQSRSFVRTPTRRRGRATPERPRRPHVHRG